MKVEIEHPFILQLDIVETEDHVPSMRVLTTVSYAQTRQRVDYQGSIWFACAAWDAFVSALRNDDGVDAMLLSMSATFKLTVERLNGQRVLVCEAREADVRGATVLVSVHAPLDDDALGSIRRKFEGFERWW